MKYVPVRILSFYLPTLREREKIKWFLYDFGAPCSLRTLPLSRRPGAHRFLMSLAPAAFTRTLPRHPHALGLHRDHAEISEASFSLSSSPTPQPLLLSLQCRAHVCPYASIFSSHYFSVPSAWIHLESAICVSQETELCRNTQQLILKPIHI